MKNTKQKILDKAKALFNDYGYSQVTIRMIASELGMSSGNLNYHFRKREDILEALYFEMVESFDKRVQALGDQDISLKLMQTNIQSSMERMMEYRFFWTDLYYLLKANNKIIAHFTKAKEMRVNGYRAAFDFLIKQKALEKPSFENEYLFLIDRMIDYSNTWLYASGLYESKESKEKIIELASFQLLSMLYPYLTKSGEEDFKNIFRPAFF